MHARFRRWPAGPAPSRVTPRAGPPQRSHRSRCRASASLLARRRRARRRRPRRAGPCRRNRRAHRPGRPHQAATGWWLLAPPPARCRSTSLRCGAAAGVHSGGTPHRRPAPPWCADRRLAGSRSAGWAAAPPQPPARRQPPPALSAPRGLHAGPDLGETVAAGLAAFADVLPRPVPGSRLLLPVPSPSATSPWRQLPGGVRPTAWTPAPGVPPATPARLPSRHEQIDVASAHTRILAVPLLERAVDGHRHRHPAATPSPAAAVVDPLGIELADQLAARDPRRAAAVASALARTSAGSPSGALRTRMACSPLCDGGRLADELWRRCKTFAGVGRHRFDRKGEGRRWRTVRLLADGCGGGPIQSHRPEAERLARTVPGDQPRQRPGLVPAGCRLPCPGPARRSRVLPRRAEAVPRRAGGVDEPGQRPAGLGSAGRGRAILPRQAIALRPELLKAHNLGNVLRVLGRPAEAADCYARRCRTVRPAFPKARRFPQRRESATSADSPRRSTASRPRARPASNLPDSLDDLGNALRDLGRVRRSGGMFQPRCNCRRSFPRPPTVPRRRPRNLGRLDEAVDSYRRHWPCGRTTRAPRQPGCSRSTGWADSARRRRCSPCVRAPAPIRPNPGNLGLTLHPPRFASQQGGGGARRAMKYGPTI